MRQAAADLCRRRHHGRDSGALRLCLRAACEPTAEAGFYKPVLEPTTDRRAVRRRRDRGRCRSCRTTASRATLGFRFGALRLFDRRDQARRGGVRRARRRRGLDRRLHAPRAARDAQPFAQTLDWIARVKPRRAILTHMDESLDYATLRRELPPGVEPGYDGLVIEV